jgi:hypothetical protein
LPWKSIEDGAPRNGAVVKVRQDGWPPYFVKYWTPALLAEKEWVDAEHGWYEYFPDDDEDGDELVDPTMWFDPTDD